MRAADLAECLSLGRSAAMRPFWLGRLAIALAAAGFATPLAAQGSGIVQPGYAVVTGFSGTASSDAPQGEDPVDYLTIDYNGVAATVVDLTQVSTQGEVTEAPKPFSVTAADVGQVYGVVIDNAPEPNIYVAATSAYGLSIYLTDDNGYVKRLHKGSPGAQFVPGQFGPEEAGGGPGSIWRIDGSSGEVSLFATIAGAAKGVAALGGLAFDPATQQIFVVERGNGLIHRITLDGVERGVYDHGIEGRPAAGLAPVPLPPAIPVNIQSPSFNTENPATWRYAPIGRRTFGLAVRNSRLYYTVAQGPQVWSVAIAPSGAIGGSPRVEVNVPAEQAGIEIASIAFDGQGRMYLAERGPPTGDYQLTALAADGASRVLRFVPKPPGDPSPGFWRLEADQYSIGMPSPYENAQGGVALSYGYQQDGSIDPGACRATLWSTGERLLDPGDPNTPPDSYPAVDGLQGNATNLVQPQNTPPYYAWYVDYDDKAGAPEYRGYVGAVVTYAPCGGAPLPPPPPPPPPKPYCPPGTYLDDYGQCRIIPTCPPGTKYSNGVCIYPTCPPGYVEYQGECVPPPQICPPGTFFYKGDCYPISCPPNMIMKPNGYCSCKPGDIFYNGKCVPPSFCPPGMITLPGGICWCPFGTLFNNGLCAPICKPGEKWINGFCVPEFCKPGEIKLPNGKCVSPCKPWEKMLPNGQCVPGGIIIDCVPGKKWVNGQCVPICKPWEHLENGICVPFEIKPDCKPFEHIVNGKCVPFELKPICKPWEMLVGNKCVPKEIGPPKPPKECKVFEHLVNGDCVPFEIKPDCKPWEMIVNGKCVPKEIGPPKPPKECKVFEHLVNGDCVPFEVKPDCKPWEMIVGNKCVPKPKKCKFNEKLIGGDCVPFEIKPDCKPWETIINGKCVPKDLGPKPKKCKPFEQLVDGDCVQKQIEEPKQCGPNQRLINNRCLDLPVRPRLPDCDQNERLVDGKCVPKVFAPKKIINPNDEDNQGPPRLKLDKPQVQCGENQKLVNGRCVLSCPEGTHFGGGICRPNGPRFQQELQQQQ